MPVTQSNRGRPVILEKAELPLGNGSDALIRLVGDGTVVQLELPLSWSLERLERSATRSGGRTKVQFTMDPVLNSASEPESAATPVTKPRATRKRASTPAEAQATPRKRAAKKVDAAA